MSTPANGRRPRTDAVRNRAHILAVARAGFADEGVELPMDAIAKRAGIGAGTLYRHFPTREALVAAVLEENFHDLERRRAGIAAQMSEPGAALEDWLDAVSAWMRAYEGLTGPLSTAHTDGASPLAPTCHLVIAATGDFLEAAQRHGHARAEVSARDLFLAALAVVWTEGAAGGEQGGIGLREMLRSGWATH